MLRTTAILIAACAAALLGACSGESAEATLDPAESPIEVALTEAAKSGKSVLVEYVKEGCSCCARMEETLADADVQEALGKVVHVTLTKGKDGGLFESRWTPPKTPAYVVFGPDGKQRGDVVAGPIEVGDFLFFLDWVAEPDGDQPEIQAIEDACGGCGDDDGAEKEDGGCGGCGDEGDSGKEKPADGGGCGGCGDAGAVQTGGG